MDEIHYRMATPADIESLVAFRDAFLAEVASADASSPQLLAALREYFSLALPAGQFIACLAVARQAIVATSGLVYHHHPPRPSCLNGREAYLMNMYTLPEWRARGIGTELLRRLIEIARDNDCHRSTLHAMPKGRSIYHKAGFVPVDTEMRLYLE